jgi:hypothetical protein
MRTLPVFVATGLASALGAAAPECRGAERVPLTVARIYFEYNASANDLGVHVLLDGEDWRKLRILDPKGRAIFDVVGRRGYKQLGMTELFFEGAEPSLTDVPLEYLLALFPEGAYEFRGRTVDGAKLEGTGTLSHAIPDGLSVSATVGPGDSVVISWDPVTRPPEGFPDLPIDIVSYQVLFGEEFRVVVPASTTKLTVSPEFVASLASGEQPFEVLAIEAGGNQTLTEGSFVKP